MKVLITSNDHPNYNQTGIIVKDLGDKGIEIKLDRTNQVVGVKERQWKMIRETRNDSDAIAYGATEGALGILGGIFN